MGLDNEAMRNFAQEKTFEKQMIDDVMSAADHQPEAAAVSETISLDFGFLMKKTGPGPVESYLDHPMNPKSSSGMARMLRGFTGIAGDLDLAVIDIALGALEMAMEKRSIANGSDKSRE